MYSPPAIPSAPQQPPSHTPTSSIQHSPESTSQTSPQIQPSSSQPNPPPNQERRGLSSRSCITCRRRKVKCNKETPCSNCVRANSACVFPAPGRAPRRPRADGGNGKERVVSPREAELLKRLRRLEGVVEDLSGQVEVEAMRQSPSSDGNVKDEKGVLRVVGMDEHGGGAARSAKVWLGRAFRIGEGPPKTEFNDGGIAASMGRLVLSEGSTSYLASPFWASITEEMDEIRETLEDQEFDSDSDAPVHPHDLITEPDHQSFIMGYSSSDVDLKILHPLPSQITFYWQTFLENVQPLVKIVHVPTMNKVIKQVQTRLDSLSKSTEALMFSIYFATITSMTESEVSTSLGASKEKLLRQYRFGVEQALARASFLNTNEIVTVQALILFLVCVRRHDDTRFVWSLTGLALRIAQSLGLHRDGTQFGLSPFDIEMRRRLWWQVCILDTRASEDHGSEPSVNEYSFDTELPLNINDDEISVDATVPPEPHIGVTEMTFCLIRYEICNLSRRITTNLPGNTPCKKAGKFTTLEDKESLIRSTADHLEATYLQYCTADAGPLYWVAATVARLIVAKMSLIIYHPYAQPGRPSTLNQETKDRLFLSSIEIIEYSILLENETSTRQWGWLFQTYIQWHAIAYILVELCHRGPCTTVDRAWNALDATFADWGGRVLKGKGGMLWQPMKKLVAKARRKREENEKLGNVNGAGRCSDNRDFTSYASKESTTEMFNMPASNLQSTEMPTSNSDSQPLMGNMLSMMTSEPTTNPFNSFASIPTTNVDSTDIDWLAPSNGLTASNGLPAPDLDMDLSTVEWEGWDEMVRDFAVQGDGSLALDENGNVIGGGVVPTLGGMGGWW